MSLPTALPPSDKPTGVRYSVLGFCGVLSMITYLDRVSISNVAPYIKDEFKLDDAQLGYLFGAFTLAYACFEIPTGWLGDRFGPRRTLIRIVLWWSAFTMLTAAVQPGWAVLQFAGITMSLSFVSLLVVRFLFGIGEAGAYPNIARAFHDWFPVGERGFAKGAVWMAGRFAGGFTPLLVYAMIPDAVGNETVVWRHTFWIFGSLGLIWCFFFWLWFRDRPDQKSSVNAAELALIHGPDHQHHISKLRVPWGKLFISPNLWLICLMYYCSSYGWYFNITFLPRFLKDQFVGIDEGAKWTAEWWQFSLMAGLPLLFGSVACLVGGLMTDRFVRRTGNRRLGRSLFGMIGHGLCAVCYFAALGVLLLYPEHASRTIGVAWLFILAVAFAAFFNDMTMGASWASCLDIGGRFSGIVAGCMNTIGNLGGFTANIVTGWILQYFVGAAKHGTPEYFATSQQAWIVNFIVFGCVYVLAVFFWAGFDASKPVTPEAHGKMPEPVGDAELAAAITTDHRRSVMR
jgi:MFS transporter, ACS family, glucarate transporter